MSGAIPALFLASVAAIAGAADNTSIIRLTRPSANPAEANTWLQTQTFAGAIEFRPQLLGKGPFLLDQTLTEAHGTLNPAIFFSYNARPNGPHVVMSEPGLAFAIEADYNDGSGFHKMESYLQYQTAGAVDYVRPFFFQLDRANGVVTGAHIIGNPLQFATSDGTPDGFTRGSIGTSIDGLGHSTFELHAPPGKKSLVNLGHGGQGGVVKLIAPTPLSGNINVASRQNSLWLFGRTPFGPGDALSVGEEDNRAVATFSNHGNHPGVKGVVVRGSSGQTANFVEVQDNMTRPRFIIDSKGDEVIRTTEGAAWIRGSVTGLMWLSTTSAVSDTTNMLPANSVIEAVVYRITVAITGATSLTIGDYANPARFVARATSLAAGETGVGTEHVDHAGAAGPRQALSAPVRVACNSTPSGGRIMITVFYRQFVAPTMN